MNRFWRVLLLSFMFHSLSGAATEVVWFDFRLNHSYADLEMSCDNFFIGSSLYFAAEIDSGKLTHAALHNTHRGEARDKAIQLSADTLAQIELYQDLQGKYWIKKLPLDATLFKWVLFHIPRGTFPQECLLPQALKSISLAPIVFEFDIKDLEEFRFSSSKRSSVTGLRQDGEKYDAKIQLVEQEFKDDK